LKIFETDHKLQMNRLSSRDNWGMRPLISGRIVCCGQLLKQSYLVISKSVADGDVNNCSMKSYRSFYRFVVASLCTSHSHLTHEAASTFIVMFDA
jgi:hypothetical protein